MGRWGAPRQLGLSDLAGFRFPNFQFSIRPPTLPEIFNAVSSRLTTNLPRPAAFPARPISRLGVIARVPKACTCPGRGFFLDRSHPGTPGSPPVSFHTRPRFFVPFFVPPLAQWIGRLATPLEISSTSRFPPLPLRKRIYRGTRGWADTARFDPNYRLIDNNGDNGHGPVPRSEGSFGERVRLGPGISRIIIYQSA